MISCELRTKTAADLGDDGHGDGVQLRTENVAVVYRQTSDRIQTVALHRPIAIGIKSSLSSSSSSSPRIKVTHRKTKQRRQH